MCSRLVGHCEWFTVWVPPAVATLRFESGHVRFREFIAPFSPMTSGAFQAFGNVVAAPLAVAKSLAMVTLSQRCSARLLLPPRSNVSPPVIHGKCASILNIF